MAHSFDMTDLVEFEFMASGGLRTAKPLKTTLYSREKGYLFEVFASCHLFDAYVVCNGGYYSLVSEMLKK